MGGGRDGRRAAASTGAGEPTDAPPQPAVPMPSAYRARGWVSTLGLFVLAVVAVTAGIMQFGKGNGQDQSGRSQSESVVAQSVKKPSGAAVAPVTPVPGTSSSPATTTSTIVVNAKDAAVVPVVPASGASGLLRPITVGVGGSCHADDMEELEAAIENESCALIQLTGSRYDIEEELVVRRSITIVGNAATLPYISAEESIRGFRVLSGASLEIRYVRLKQGKGIIRKRSEFNLRRQVQEGQGVPSSPELFGPDMMIEIRGGSVYFESGSLGGSFIGVFFIQDESTAEAVSEAIQQTLTNTGMRIYGGHIYIAGGRITFNACLFYDTEVLTALNDRIYLGGDVLILAGEADFSGCVWIYTTLIGTENGAGFNIAVLGGVITMSYCYFQENTIAAAYNGVGQAFFIVGGVQIVTGCAFSLFTALELFTGTGDFTVLGGVLVMTGVAINDILGMVAAFGAGFDFTVGAGFMIQTGCSLNQYTGPAQTSTAGGYVFVGIGEYIAIGSQYEAWTSIGHENGVGGVYWVGGGMCIVIGTPIIDVSGIYASELMGEFTGLASGFLVIIGCPTIEYSGIEYYTGLGGTTFVGAGAAVLGRSPMVEAIGIVNKHKDWWIQGTCEEFESEWAEGPLFFVPPSTVCPPPPAPATPAPPPSRMLALPSNATATTATVINATTTDPPRKKIGLIAWDLEKIKLNLRDEEGKGFLSRIKSRDGKLLQVAERMQDFFNPDQPRTTRSPANVHVVNAPRDYCGVCGTVDLTGPGAEACTYEASCSALQTPIGTPDTFLEEGTDTEYFLVMMDVEVGLPARRLDASANGTANATDSVQALEQLLVKGLRRALGVGEERDPANYLRELAMQVKVYSSDIDPYFHNPAPTTHAAPPKIPLSRKAVAIATSKASDVRRFKAVVILNEKASADGLKDTLDKENTEETMATALQSSLKSEGVETDWTSVSMDSVLHVPAYNTEAWKQAIRPMKTDFGGYFVELVDPEAPARPVSNVKFGKAYTLELKRFASNTLVNVTAVAATDEAVTKSITTLTTDARGRAEAAIKFDLSTLPAGNYYIKVTESSADAPPSSRSAAYGSTPVLAFAAEVKRRLYGRSMSF